MKIIKPVYVLPSNSNCRFQGYTLETHSTVLSLSLSHETIQTDVRQKARDLTLNYVHSVCVCVCVPTDFSIALISCVAMNQSLNHLSVQILT